MRLCEAPSTVQSKRSFCCYTDHLFLLQGLETKKCHSSRSKAPAAAFPRAPQVEQQIAVGATRGTLLCLSDLTNWKPSSCKWVRTEFTQPCSGLALHQQKRLLIFTQRDVIYIYKAKKFCSVFGFLSTSFHPQLLVDFRPPGGTIVANN